MAPSKLQVLEVTCIVRGDLGRLGSAVTIFSCLLGVQGKGLSPASHNIVPLKKFVLRLTLRGKCPNEILEVMHSWPSFATVYINGWALEQLTPS